MENLKALKQIDLTQNSVEEINKLLNQIGPLPIMRTEYHNGKIFDRAVRIKDDEADFNTRCRLSYAPAEYNVNYLRASTPENTMFYGSVLKDNYTIDDHGYTRITACCETSELLRDNSIANGERLMIIGTWEVQDFITLATIFDPTKEYDIDYLQEIKSRYLTLLKQNPELETKGIEYLKFLAEEFSKDVKNGENYEYHISALFSALISNTGVDGVLYPSVRASGIGLCVAIHPRVLNKLKLVSVRKCLLKKENGQVKITYLKACDVEDDSKPFKLLDIEEYKQLKNESKN
ncbi:hypothetical protein [Anditalea andensis]|nr:hypothetical protein [Anditalea andensis]